MNTPANKKEFPVLHYWGRPTFTREFPYVDEPARETPIMASVDVLIVGGGPAGYAAAISAAKQGADVLLVEKYGFLGGLATHGIIRGWFPRHNLYPEFMGGVAEDLVARMKEVGAAERVGTKWTFNDLVLRIVLDAAVGEAGANTLLHSTVVRALVDDEVIKGVVVENKLGRQALVGKIVIDASGDGDVAAFAGATCDQWEKTYRNPMTFCIDIGGVDETKANHQLTLEILEEGVRTGKVDVLFERFAYASQRPGEGKMAHCNVEVTGRDGSNAWDLTLAEKEGRQKVHRLLKFLRNNVPGYSNAYLAYMPVQISVESTRRVLGDYVLTGDDVVSGRQFDDSICTGTPKAHYGIFLDKSRPVWNGIPYRCLLPRGVQNLLTAGRCFSSTYEAFRGHPDMPVCMAMGQAAGTAAALACRNEVTPREVSVSELQASLKDQGVWIGGDKQPSAPAAN